MYVSPINFTKHFYAFVCNRGFNANFAFGKENRII